ncbi:hypothetical protein FACS1894122_08850 [Alphaproteobacteria bacterium]|nr:hypothetical protein FACS1894122_08850 [Alphaproteobacteria bacterium]
MYKFWIAFFFLFYKGFAEENFVNEVDLMPTLLMAYEKSVDKLPAIVPTVSISRSEELLQQIYFNLNRMEVSAEKNSNEDELLDSLADSKTLVRKCLEPKNTGDVFNSTIESINSLQEAIKIYNTLAEEQNESLDLSKIAPIINDQKVMDSCYRHLVADMINKAKDDLKDIPILVEELDKMLAVLQ